MINLDGPLPREVKWARGGLWARFTPEIERFFRRHYERDLLQRARWSAVIAASVMAVYSVLDIFMIPQAVLHDFLAVRWLFMILPLIAVTFLSYTQFGEEHLQKVAAAASVSSALAVVAMIVIARHNGTPIEYEGIILTTFYFYCCGGLRLKWALLAGLAGTIAYPLAEAAAGLGPHELVVRSIFLISANIVGLVSAAFMELAARRGFAQLMALEAISCSDPLTGLLNRRALDAGLPGLFKRAAKEGKRVQVAMIDVDYFKQYNDFYGHADGDQVLRDVAKLFTRHCDAQQDLAARYGGEEFICLWLTPYFGGSEARLHAILRDVATLRLPHDRSPLRRVSVSLGVVDLLPSASTDPAVVLRRADELLYRAKSEGRDCAILDMDMGAQGKHAGLRAVRATL